MGNRGDLHAEDGSLGTRRWRLKRWISCTLDPGNGPGVSFDAPGRYYPLFFHDELVALAAGHRPCAACRRRAFVGFMSAWETVHGVMSLPDLDRALHQNRLDQNRQRRHQVRLRCLPGGVFVKLRERGQEAFLWWDGVLLPWSHAGYAQPVRVDAEKTVTVLTPTSIIRVMAEGYKPEPNLRE